MSDINLFNCSASSQSSDITDESIAVEPESRGDTSEDTNRTIDFDSMICKICLSFLRQPLPCRHVLCLDCFKNTSEMVSLLCPFCRKRFSCWARSAGNKDKNLIDWTKWNSIQTQISDSFDIKSDVFEEQIDDYRPVHRVIASSGELRKEYEEMAQKEIERHLEEEKSSELLIQQLLAEDQRLVDQMQQNLSEETANDEEIARNLQLFGTKDTKTLRNRTYFCN